MTTSIDVAIIGAGPYGLSLAAHLRAREIDFRIFGTPMEFWKANMPAGMLLKSYPWASRLHDPESHFTIKRFCTEYELPYHDTLMALTLESYVDYGDAFQRRYVPNVEQKRLVSLEQIPRGFLATFEDHETVRARKVVLAIGLHAFRRVPDAVVNLSADVLSHSADYGPLDGLREKQVIVIGAGASATDLAGLLHEQGTDVSILARANEVRFACLPRLRGVLERVSDPHCGIGSGWMMKFCSDAPSLIRMLPAHLRAHLAKQPGPLGGAFMKELVIDEVPLMVGRCVDTAEQRGGRVYLRVVSADGAKQTLDADHVIAATGYKIDLGRLSFLGPRLRAGIHCSGGAPVLSGAYEASVPGLHFIGPVAATSFGPVARFVFGAAYPSRRLVRHLSRRTHHSAAPAHAISRVNSPVLR
jgi:hypothetical protein